MIDEGYIEARESLDPLANITVSDVSGSCRCRGDAAIRESGAAIGLLRRVTTEAFRIPRLFRCRRVEWEHRLSRAEISPVVLR